jgi:hypothetical protein
LLNKPNIECKQRIKLTRQHLEEVAEAYRNGTSLPEQTVYPDSFNPRNFGSVQRFKKDP